MPNFIIEDRVFTMDALYTQRDIAQTIVKEGGDYVMIATLAPARSAGEKNQPTLCAEIEQFFAELNVEAFVTDSNTTVNDGKCVRCKPVRH